MQCLILIQLTAKGHFNYLQFGVIIYKNAVNIYAYVFVPIEVVIALSKYLEQ